MDFETLKVVQKCCDYFARLLKQQRVVVTIHSGARCLMHNRAIGASDASQHVKARAIDFHIVGVRPFEVYAYLDKKYEDRYGIGSYKTFTHIDTRSNGPARW